jgi:hypothetical protein
MCEVENCTQVLIPKYVIVENRDKNLLLWGP